MSMRMLFDWLFATLCFALAGWAGHNHYGGDPDHWRMVFILATGAYTAGHWQGHYLGRHHPHRLDRSPNPWADMVKDIPVPRELRGREEPWRD